ncbi:MAG: hypothetical protein ABI697_12135, partial [Devosia sp.]
ARKAITDMVDQRLGTLPEAITARADITAERLASLNTAINTALVQSMADLEAGADRIEETISKRIVSATSNITLDIAETADRMDTHVRQALEQIHQAAGAIDEVISIKAVAAAEAIEGRITGLSDTVSTQTETLTELVTSRSQEIESLLRSHGNVLQEALAASAAQTEQLMSAVSDRIQQNANGAFERLNDANRVLQDVLETANTTLSQLEGSVASQTAAYAETVRAAAASTEENGGMLQQQVNALQGTVRDMVDQVGVMMNSLRNEVSAIDQSASALSDAGGQSLGMLEERRAAMDALAQSFTARADEIDERMRGFAETIANTVNDTERRLLDTRSQIEEVLSNSAGDVATHLAGFSQSATAETEKASDVLRQTQATMILEMQQALEEATRRFNETAISLRQTAKDVGGELEATRSELAKGIVDLPEETRTSAAAMRRVVAEQIEALSELNAIVRAQSATHDLSERRAAPRAEPRPEPAPQPVRAEPPPRPAPQPVQQPARTLNVAEAPAPLRPAAPPLAPVAEARPAPQADNGGWLRDVLRNANAPAPAAAQPNLTALTDEIARSIDSPALADAWARYQRGEQSVFSRRVYTLTGQSTFDEVKRRLQRDQDFAKNAASYMAEFEQLLQRAAQGPDPLNETRSYLLSDRGKVYTMLAHASGRLG